jgi:hypothetical protein
MNNLDLHPRLKLEIHAVYIDIQENDAKNSHNLLKILCRTIYMSHTLKASCEFQVTSLGALVVKWSRVEKAKSFIWGFFPV